MDKFPYFWILFCDLMYHNIIIFVRLARGAVQTSAINTRIA